MNETLAFGLKLTFLGMGIVFLVLLLIAFMIWCIRKVDQKLAAPKTKTVSSEESKEHQTIDDQTLVLIAATVATMFLGRARIRSIKRVLPAADGSGWSMRGRVQLMGSHLLKKSNRG